MPISWCFLIARAVQDESLVGDRQFWVTRPYEWPKLLAAKALLAAVFINVPLFIADVILLDKAGFSPVHYLPGLLWMQLLMILFLIVPAAVAGAVTSTIVQLLLCVVGIVLYLIGVVSLVAGVPNADMSSNSNFGSASTLLIFVGACAAVILVQYARRRAWASRIIIFAAAGLVAIVLATMPYGTLVARAFPPLRSRRAAARAAGATTANDPGE